MSRVETWNFRPQKKGEHGRVGKYEWPSVALETLNGCKKGPYDRVDSTPCGYHYWKCFNGHILAASAGTSWCLSYGACPDASGRSESYHVLL